MKSKILILIMMVAGLMLANSMVSPTSAQKKMTKKELVKTKKYYCPHHPNEVSDKPGKCPICGMALVEMPENGKKAVKEMKMDKDKKMEKSEMKGEMKKMKKSKEMKTMKEMKKDSVKMKPDKM